MNRQSLATAQILPAITRKMVAENLSDADTEVCARAAELARQSAPMYEGCYTFAQIYMGNIGIIKARMSEPGEE